MSLLIWIASATGSALIGLLLSLLFGDSLKRGVFAAASKLSLRQSDGLDGLWLATFYFPNPESGGEIEYVEVVELQEQFGLVTGRIVPDPRNHTLIKGVEARRPVRLRGQLKDNNYLTGIWLHPRRRAHYHGSFQLIVYPSGDEMDGQWIGFSRSKNQVLSGRWHWQRAGDQSGRLALPQTTGASDPQELR